MTIPEQLRFVQDSVDQYREVQITVTKLWGWAIVMEERGYPIWKKTNQDLGAALDLLVDVIYERDDDDDDET